MKYIIAVKYKNPDDALYNSEIFEFDSKEDRTKFVRNISHIAEEIAFSQIEENE